MDFFSEIKAREIIVQTTNEEKTRELINDGKAVFYIGFDPTADSLHVGHFAQMLLISRLQRAGDKAICLFGGGTAMVGDPSGKDDMRKIMNVETIEHNITCLTKQASKFLDTSKTTIVNNADWLLNLNYIEFLREIGVHFSVNRMLSAECYKQRFESGLTFFELNYMIMQSYDFLVLHRKYGCNLQIGGNDQWSNIIGGVELIRRADGAEVYGMTTNLLTKSDGKKIGKTEKGALWLNPDKTTPYEFYQYWRNVSDSDIINCMKILTFLSLEEIEGYEKISKENPNAIKEKLAFEVTALVHGKEDAMKSQTAAKSVFGGSFEGIPQKTIDSGSFSGSEIGVLDLLRIAGIAATKSDARRLIEQGGITIDGEKISEPTLQITEEKLTKGIIMKKGKKTYLKVISLTNAKTNDLS